MAQGERSTDAALDASRALEAQNGRLQRLVGELLAANQELRFRLAALERAPKHPDLDDPAELCL